MLDGHSASEFDIQLPFKLSEIISESNTWQNVSPTWGLFTDGATEYTLPDETC